MLEQKSSYDLSNRLSVPWIALFLGFGFLAICMVVASSTSGGLITWLYGAPADLATLAKDPAGHFTFRAIQIFSAVVVWGLAATFWSIYTGGFRLRLGFQYKTWPGFIALASLITIVALPMVEWMLFNENTFSLPESMAGFENWVKKTEASNQVALLNVLSDLSPGAVLGNILIIAVVPAIVEEMFFRGFLMNTLTRMMNPHIAVWASALIFSLIHMQFYGLVSRLVLGAMLGYYFLWSGNLWASIVAHFTHNFVSLIIALLAIKGVLRNDFLQDDFAFGTLTVLCSVCLTIPLVYLFIRNSRKRNTVLSHE